MEEKSEEIPWTVLSMAAEPKDKKAEARINKALREHKNPDRKDAHIITRVGTYTHTQIMNFEGPIKRRKIDPIEMIMFGPPEIRFKTKGKAQVYSDGAVVAIAWMDVKPPPTRFLLQTAREHSERMKFDLFWPDGEPK